MENTEDTKDGIQPIVPKNITLEVQDASVTLCMTFGDPPQSNKEE